MRKIPNLRFQLPLWILPIIILLTSSNKILHGEAAPIENTTSSMDLDGLPEFESNDTTFMKILDVPDTFQVIQISPVATKLLEINYEVTVKKEKCCPVIYFLAHLPNGNYNGLCYTKEKCFSDGFQNVATFSQFILYLKQGFPHSGCVEKGDNLVCSGKRKLGFASPRIWWFAAGYPCDSKQSLQMDIRMNLNFNAQPSCQVLQEPTCVEKYNQTKTGFPNWVGQSSQSDASLFFKGINIILRQTNCYKHLELFICKSIFHDCGENGPIPPCHQMCKDLTTGCANEIVQWKQRIHCQYFPATLDQNVCFYLPVICPELISPQHGSLVVNGQNLSSVVLYSCDEGYELEGPSVRMCLHSGEWNGTEPVCIQSQGVSAGSLSLNHKVFIGLACAVAIILIVGLCIRFRANINLLIFYNDYVGKDRNRPGDEQKELFLTYSSLDSDYVEETLLPEMKQHIPAWKIMTFEKDFIPGQPLLDTIKKSIWHCQAVLVFLTENYIRSAWCEYEFSEAQTRSAIDKNFRLIIILQEQEGEEKPLDLEQLPEHLRTFVKTRVYLKADEILLWHKLRRGLTK